MKLKTKLWVTFIIIVVLPILLTTIAYLVIGATVVLDMRDTYGVDSISFSFASNPASAYDEIISEHYETIKEYSVSDPAQLEDREFLGELDESLSEVSAFVVVKKGESLYYVSADSQYDPIVHQLTDLADTDLEYYFKDIRRLVKKASFTFSDGSQGNIYLVTKVNSMISEALVTAMLIAMIVVLVTTGILLIIWLRRSMFTPMNQLKDAMKKIAEGDLDTELEIKEKGEIKDLFDNFEIMRKQLKQNAEEKALVEKTNRELISNISHDLKTPITSIKGYVEGIMDDVADSPEKMNKYIRTIYNKANDMDLLINELTVYSQLDAKSIPYRFHQISVTDYFGDCTEEVGLDLEQRGIHFTYTNEVENDTLIWADPEQLKRVINNIIANSIKYRRQDNAAISIHVGNLKNLVQIDMEDNGKGIPAADLEKIFERFYRTDASRNSAQGGSGIGLSISKKIVEEHGGEIWATGEEGKGLAIHFTLRKCVVEEEVAETPEESGPFNKIEKIIKNTAKRIETEAEKVSLERFGINELEKGIKERFTPKKGDGSKKSAQNKKDEDKGSGQGGTEE
ncbi:MAG: HAMP domain-containing histidine kinase [Lachnospiraceae bacterium]|nr:HAMP domain-containing histidine kinase [Lachnospiraceae bacterium]